MLTMFLMGLGIGFTGGCVLFFIGWAVGTAIHAYCTREEEKWQETK